MLKILLKNPGASRFPVTTIVSSATTPVVTDTESRPPPFFPPYSAARAPAPPGSSGSAWAAAERGRVHGALQRPVGAIPGADVDRQGAHAEQND